MQPRLFGHMFARTRRQGDPAIAYQCRSSCSRAGAVGPLRFVGAGLTGVGLGYLSGSSRVADRAGAARRWLLHFPFSTKLKLASPARVGRLTGLHFKYADYFGGRDECQAGLARLPP